ncbi:family 20 glycosylhydrolase [uncultured Algoriphagus sp.]|uniref:family 20 glycosylhydrolase n=1 Tax=uncultured Algoriphagus sp. TaxID=417365 RepID=UPI002596D23C|nr:family 20 glycosylhydrolase [uncultured Algoriphagus sp.]
MKNILLPLICLLLNHFSFAQHNHILPKPTYSLNQPGEYTLKAGEAEFAKWDSLLLSKLETPTLPVALPDWLSIKKVDKLSHDPLYPDQAYRLQITATGIYIESSSETGMYYAWQSIKQLKRQGPEGLIFPILEIKDGPTFRIRGFMHDVGRSFIPVDELMHQIELLSSYKINVFHWHLTEDLAWRLESKTFPQLTAAKHMERFPGSFYSQTDVKQLLAHARRHHVTVIPEIDMPGHSQAFERAMGFGMQTKEGKEALKLILAEVRALFPDSPYVHLGTDEVRFTDPTFVPEMVEFSRSLGFKVISWNPGWEYQEGEIDLLHLWSYRGQKKGSIPVVDSRFHYINHFDPFADLIGLFRSNVLGQDRGDDVVAGSILATWNDRKLEDSEAILKENSFYPLMLTFAERLWRGGGKGYFDKLGVKYPESEAERAQWEEFEGRLIFHKQTYFQGLPFPYVPQGNLEWKIFGPFPNEGKLDQKFPIEKVLLNGNAEEIEVLPSIDAKGGSIYLRHVWGSLVPAYLEEPLPHSTAYAYTSVYSPEDQELEAWVGTQHYSRSEQDLPPPAGKWDWRESKIWVNGREIQPPNWINRHTEKSQEVSLQNENFQARPSTQISLKKGWNTVIFKLPVAEFSSPETRLVKWMFTFVIPNLNKQ